MRKEPFSRAPADPIMDQPGLRKRMKKEAVRVSSQHRQLDEFFEALSDALARGSLEGARLSYTRFRDALEAHLTLEDQVFFPALRGLEPEIGGALTDLIEEHHDFREQLETLYDLIARGRRDPFAKGVHALADQVWEHEQREEALIAEITGRAKGA